MPRDHLRGEVLWGWNLHPSTPIANTPPSGGLWVSVEGGVRSRRPGGPREAWHPHLPHSTCWVGAAAGAVHTQPRPTRPLLASPLRPRAVPEPGSIWGMAALGLPHPSLLCPDPAWISLKLELTPASPFGGRSQLWEALAPRGAQLLDAQGEMVATWQWRCVLLRIKVSWAWG